MRKEFKPILLNPARIFVALIILCVPIVLIWTVIPKTLEVYRLYPNVAEPKMILVAIILVLIVCTGAAIGFFLSARNAKIILENNLMQVWERMLLGTWKMKTTIALNKVNMFTDRKQTFFVYAGKGMIPVVRYWWMANYEDGQKSEFLANVWDKKVLIEMAHYIQEKFPNIKFKTEIYSDTPERISGLDKFMTKAKS